MRRSLLMIICVACVNGIAADVLVGPENFYTKTRFVRYGDTIICKGGTYDTATDGKFWPASSTQPTGTITIRAAVGETPVFTGKAYYAAAFNLSSGPKRGFIIEGLTFEGITGHAILGKKTSEVIIRDCTFGALKSGNSIYLLDSQDIRIDGCYFPGPVGSCDAGGSGEFIFTSRCIGITTANCTFGNCGHYNVTYQGTTDSHILNNWFKQTWGGGASLGLYAERCVVADNIFSPAIGAGVSYTKAGLAINSSNNVIRGNAFLGTAGSQFSVTLGAYTFAGKRQDCVGNKIDRNLFVRSGGPAVYVYQKDVATCADNEITGNLFHGNSINGNQYFYDASLVYDDYHSVTSCKWDRKVLGHNTFSDNIVDATFSVMVNGVFRLPIREAEQQVPNVILDNTLYEEMLAIKQKFMMLEWERELNLYQRY